MQYLTRELWDSVCKTDQYSEEAHAAFKKARSRYEAYLDSLRGEIPGDVQCLAAMELHDFTVRAVHTGIGGEQLRLELHYASKRHPRTLIILFFDIDQQFVASDVEGDHILLHEVAVRGNGSYEFSALLEKTELSVVFRSVQVQDAIAPSSTQ